MNIFNYCDKCHTISGLCTCPRQPVEPINRNDVLDKAIEAGKRIKQTVVTAGQNVTQADIYNCGIDDMAKAIEALKDK